MALLPARRNGTLSRPGSQAPGRWDPFAEFEDLYQRMGSGEFRESGSGHAGSGAAPRTALGPVRVPGAAARAR
jgi:hypothetical protein